MGDGQPECAWRGRAGQLIFGRCCCCKVAAFTLSIGRGKSIRGMTNNCFTLLFFVAPQIIAMPLF